MANKEKCLIIMVLDRSGSMASIREDTIGGVNTFWKDQEAFPGKCFVTLVQFDTEYEVVFQNQPLQTVRPLDNNSFVPRGGTALLDAIGQTINSTAAELASLPEEDKPGRVFFVIITDGEENSSVKFTRQTSKDVPGVFEMISHHRDNLGWEFVFLGANQDAIEEARNYGIDSASSMTYCSTSAGVKGTYEALSKKMGDSRSTGGKVMFDDQDRQSATQQ